MAIAHRNKRPQRTNRKFSVDSSFFFVFLVRRSLFNRQQNADDYYTFQVDFVWNV